MEKLVRISHPNLLNVKKAESPGKFSLEQGGVAGFYFESDVPEIISLKMDFEVSSDFNSITMSLPDSDKRYYPSTFRFEISNDGVVWEPILQEIDYNQSSKRDGKWNFSLIRARYLKLVMKVSETTDAKKYKVSFKNLRASVSGVTKISVSSENDRLWVKENLLDGRPDYGWSSKEKESPGEENILLDLGSVHRVVEFRMLSKKEKQTHFPEHFTVYYSENDISWHQLFEEPRFIAEPGCWYRWRFLETNIRFLKIICYDRPTANKRKCITQIIDLELYAAPDLIDLSKKDKKEPLPYASVLRSGLVRLAGDGETSDALAVQGSDRRLKDATIEFKGIVELASDGEDKPGVVVQGNDRRLKYADESSPGLVRLARDGDEKEKMVVQSSDSRLKKASTDSFGIVELAEDGETRPGVVVQGNDKRLKRATQKEAGLVVLAEHGEAVPGKVLTSDDPRFKKATTANEGILRFAENGEELPNAAVQGNDKRLRNATTEYPGIVELARSGESKEGLAVQGNDERLRNATEDSPGIVMLASPGTKVAGKVVIAEDPRLHDKREPLPHTHEYADKIHDFSSHSGYLRLTGTSEATHKGIVAPHKDYGILYGKNESTSGSGVVGVGAKEGVFGFGKEAGVVGQSNGDDKNSAGISGSASNGFGGMFISQKNYALYAEGGGSPSREIKGSGKAIFAVGESLFKGTVRVSDSIGACLACCFRFAKSDVLSPGDLLALSREEGKVEKSKQAYSQKVAGVMVESAALELGSPDMGADFILVAVGGIVQVNADGGSGEILPGDLLVSSLTGGHVCKADPEKLKPGMCVGKALGAVKKGAKGKIPMLLNQS